MKPIHEILNRIRWDREYARADFKVGYYDRLEGYLSDLRMEISATDLQDYREGLKSRKKS